MDFSRYAKFARSPKHHIKGKIISVNAQIAIQFCVQSYRPAARPWSKVFFNSAKYLVHIVA